MVTRRNSSVASWIINFLSTISLLLHLRARKVTNQSLILDAPCTSNMENGKDKDLPSFWIPSLTPNAEKTKVAKPDSKVYLLKCYLISSVWSKRWPHAYTK